MKGNHRTMLSSWKRWLKGIKLRMNAFLIGAAMSWVMVPYNQQHRRELERIFSLETSLRLLGMPLLPGVYNLKILPYLVPNLLYWKRMTAFDRAIEDADLKHLGH